MKSSQISLNVNDAVKRLTLSIRVSGVPRLRARLWLGSALIKLAAFVIGTPVAVTFE